MSLVLLVSIRNPLTICSVGSTTSISLQSSTPDNVFLSSPKIFLALLAMSWSACMQDNYRNVGAHFCVPTNFGFSRFAHRGVSRLNVKNCDNAFSSISQYNVRSNTPIEAIARQTFQVETLLDSFLSYTRNIESAHDLCKRDVH